MLNSNPAKLPFIQHGFNNWTKALEKFRGHECSNMHKEATEKLIAKGRGVGIDAQLDPQLGNNQELLKKCYEATSNNSVFFTSRITFASPQKRLRIF